MTIPAPAGAPLRFSRALVLFALVLALFAACDNPAAPGGNQEADGGEITQPVTTPPVTTPPITTPPVTTPPPAPAVTGVSVSPAATSVVKGGTQQFTATVTVTGGAAQTVTWSVEGGGDGTSINSTGLLSVAGDEAASPLTIRAASTADPSKSGTATVTVTVTPPPQYTVTYHINGGGGTTPASQTAAAGSSVTLDGGSGFTRTGYIFAGWNTYPNGTGSTYSAGYSYTVTDNVTLYAQWTDTTPPQYTITYDINGGSGTTPASQTVNASSIVTLDSGSGLSKTGYTFAGWNTNSDGTGTTLSAGYSCRVTGNVTLYAQWTAIQYTVSYNSNGGGGTTPASQTVNVGSGVTLDDGSGLFKVGHAFAGWNTNSGGTGSAYNAGASYVPAADITLYAQWTAITYTVAYNGNGNTGGSTASSSHTYNVSQTLAANGFTRTGHTFAGWNAQADGGGASYAGGASVTNLAATQGETVTLYAQWTAIQYTVTYNANGGNGTTPASQTVNAGSGVTLSEQGGLTRTGYTFSGWNTSAYGTGSPYSPGTSYTPSANITLYAKWTAHTYTVAYNGNGNTGGSTASSAHTYDVSQTLVPNGFTRTGYAFTGWNTQAGGGGDSYTGGASVTNLTATHAATVTLYAQWIAQYTITYSANGGGGTTPAFQTVNAGSTVTLDGGSGLSKTGYTFAGWNTNSGGTGSAYNAGASYTPSANITLYAQWTVNTYTVAYNANGGTGTTASSTHTYGEAKNLAANGFTRTGYTFAGWNTQAGGGGTSYTGGASVTSLTTANNATVTLYAQWTYNPAGIVTVSFTGLPQDEDITLSGVNTLSWTANTPLFVSVSGSGFTAYRWELDGAALTGKTAATLTLYGGELSVKRHTLTVFVTKNGVEYTKRVTFTVTQ